ncbi:MAG TPA: hypothetical protein VLG09_01395 [Candidatus Saccharimonadales bacterium]|nr:hypothetical protein [Candidatus Saccharimonadales bacterium]
MTPLNLTEAVEPDFKPIPAGKYHLEIVEVKMGEMTQDGPKLPAGTRYYNVQYRVTDEFAGDGETVVENRRLFDRHNIAPEGHELKASQDGYLLAWFKAIGFPEDEIRSGEFDPELDEFRGLECMGVVTIDKWDGKDVNRVKILPLDD